MLVYFCQRSFHKYGITVRQLVGSPTTASAIAYHSRCNTRFGSVLCTTSALNKPQSYRPVIYTLPRHINLASVCYSKSHPGIFTPSKKGVEVPFVIKPDLNLGSLFGSEYPELERSLEARGKTIHLQGMIDMWKDLKALDAEKSEIESARQENKKKAKELARNKTPVDSEEVIVHRQEGKNLRENLKLVNGQIDSLRDALYPAALSLPNLLHPDVPIGSEDKVREEIPVSSDSREGQFALRAGKESISTNHGEVHPGTCYLEGEIPLVEQRLLDRAEEFLLQRGFNQMSCPDMIKPYMLEALGQEYKEQDEVYHIQENDMCLTGLAPLNFYAYYMMSVIEAKDLPERCFSIGQSYNAQNESQEFTGLHQHFQGSQVQLCSLFQSSSQEEAAQFDSLMVLLKDFYGGLGVPYRIVDTASQNLIPAVHRRRGIELWLSSSQSFEEVASVTSCCDYVSRRLMIRYPRNPFQSASESRDRKYAYTIYGTALNCNVLLESLLER